MSANGLRSMSGGSTSHPTAPRTSASTPLRAEKSARPEEPTMPEDPYAHMIPGSDAACFLLQREHANVQIVARFTVTGEPVSKARARFTKTGHSYTPDATRTAENQVAWRFRAASKSKAPDGANAFGVFGIFFAATQQRRDVDNMLKLLLDALNKVAWADDSQVTEISGRKVLVDEPSDARTEVVVYRLGPVHVRTGTCEHCGGTFPAFRSQKARRFCSRECDQARRALARLRTCPRCATRFDPKHHTQKYCTPACKRADHSVDATCVECGNQYRRWLSHARQSVDACTPQCRQAYWSKHSAKNSQGTCAACGGSTSKKTYTRCRPCVMSGRQIVRTAPQDVAPPGRVVLTIRELP